MIYLILGATCFSFSFGLIKNQLASIHPELIVFLRLTLAGLVFLPFIRKIEIKKHLIAAFIGVIQFGLMFEFFIRAFQYLQGNEIALLTASTPLFVAIFSNFFGQRFNVLYLISITLSIFGAVIIIWDNTGFNFLIKGITLMQLSNICFAAGQVLWKKYIIERDVNLMASAYLTSAVFLLPFVLTGNNFVITSINLNQWLSILYLGIVPTGIGFWLWNKGTKYVSSYTLAVMNNLKIPMGAFFAIVIFHEKVNVFNFIIGSILILSAMALTNLSKENKIL